MHHGVGVSGEKYKYFSKEIAGASNSFLSYHPPNYQPSAILEERAL